MPSENKDTLIDIYWTDSAAFVLPSQGRINAIRCNGGATLDKAVPQQQAGHGNTYTSTRPSHRSKAIPWRRTTVRRTHVRPIDADHLHGPYRGSVPRWRYSCAAKPPE